MQLSEQDLATIKDARKNGVIDDINDEKYNFHAGVIAVVCPDGDQAEKRNHLERLVAAHNGDKRVHLITYHGAAIVLSTASPLSNRSIFLSEFIRDRIGHATRYTFLKYLFLLVQPFVWLFGRLGRYDVQVISNIWAAIRMKKIDTIVLYVHAPCGAAAKCRHTFTDEIDHLIRAKRRLKRWLGYLDIKVVCLCHVDYGQGKKNTYFVGTHKAQRWLQGG